MFKFRKIASVLASAIMVSSTVALAAAANYPAPFVQNGGADVAIVYGANANIVDAVAAADISTSLNTELARQTAVGGSTTGASASGGDAINLGVRGSQKLYYGDALNIGLTSIGASELPTVLKDGKFVDLSGTEYTYSQSVSPGATVSAFGTSGGDLNDPALYLDVGTDPASGTGALYNYTLTLNKNLNVSDSVNVQGQKINIQGVDYVIGSSSTNTTLYLYGAGQAVTVAGGETVTVSINGVDHVVELVSTSSASAAKLTVDGVSKSVTKGSSYAFAGDLNVYVKDITHPAYAGDIRSADIVVGANTLLIQNGQSVKVGADQTTIKGTYGTITAAGAGLISAIKIQETMAKSTLDNISPGGSFTDSVFGGLKVQFAGEVPSLNSTAGRSMVKVSTDNNQYGYLTFTSARAGDKGEEQITYVYDNATSASSIQPLLAHQTLGSNNKGLIHVYEGEAASVNDWIVINQQDAGTILNVDDISLDTATSGTVTFSDVITGESQKVTLTNATGQTSGAYAKSGVNFFGGTGYSISTNGAGTTVNISWSTTNTKTLFPRIKLANGGWIALLSETTIANGSASAGPSIIYPDGLTTLATTGDAINITTDLASNMVNGINWTFVPSGGNILINGIVNAGGATACNFSANKGPAVLLIEPKKWNDASFGNFICVPLTTAGTTEIGIGTPAFNGSNSGWSTLGSDTYMQKAVDKFGTLGIYESRTNENNVATFWMPTSQMYLDVLFTAAGATVTGGSASSGGSVKTLGNVIVRDSEASSITDRNLIVVGGSCINSVAASLIGANAGTCGADFTTKTSVAAGQFLIQTFSRTGGKFATLVAGYDASDTTNAAKYLTTQTVDTSVGKKYVGTSATSATVTTVTA